ncbi:hypothetical protein Tco_1393780 [Tanacetum coccineum]
MASYKQIQLKKKSFAEIQKLFDKAMTKVNMFVDMDTELVRESSKKDEAEMAQESSSKRAGDELEQEKAKKQKIDDDQEEAKLKELMEVISDEEGIATDAIPLSTKPPSIVDYKIIKEGKISIYQIIRAYGSSKRNPVWRTLQDEKVLIWKLFDSCGVHFLRLQSMHIFMLVEKKYPLTPATITCMLNKKLQDDHWNEMCYQLLKLMIKQLKNPGSGRIVGIKSFIRLFRINVALIKVSAAQEERVNAAGTKLQLLTELQLLMDKDCSKKDKDCLCDMYEIFL